MREPLCICWASLTSGIVSRAAGDASELTGFASEIKPVPAPVFVEVAGASEVRPVPAVVAVGAATGLLTLDPILKILQKRNG
jgi:hypothetical protein